MIKRIDPVFILLTLLLLAKSLLFLQTPSFSPEGAALGLKAGLIAKGDFSPLFNGEPLYFTLKILFAGVLFFLFGAGEAVLFLLPLLFYTGWAVFTYWNLRLLGDQKAARTGYLLSVVSLYWLNTLAVHVEGAIDILFYGSFFLFLLLKCFYGKKKAPLYLRASGLLIAVFIALPLASFGWSGELFSHPFRQLSTFLLRLIPYTFIENFNSAQIVRNFLWFLVFLPLITALFWAVKEVRLNCQDKRFPLIILLVLSLFYGHRAVTGSTPVIFPALFLFPLLTGLYLSHLNRQTKILFWAALLLLAVPLGIRSSAFISDHRQKSALEKETAAEIISECERLQLNSVYAPVDLADKLYFQAKGSVHFSFLNGEPLKKSSPALKKGFLIPDQESRFFEEYLASLNISYKKKPLTHHEIYYAIQTLPLGEELNSESWVGPERAFDRDLSTRWSTYAPQQPGQHFEIELPKIETLTGMELRAPAYTDLPEQLQIEVSRNGKNWNEITVVKLKPYPLYWLNQVPFTSKTDGRAEISFQPVRAKFIRLTQTGTNRIFYWSVSELFLFKESGRSLKPNAAEARSPGSQPETGSKLKPLSRTNWQTEANPNPERSRRAIQEKPGKSWTTNAPQKKGMFFLIDLGQKETVKEIRLKTGKSHWEYPRAFEIHISDDKENWKKANIEQTGIRVWDGKRFINAALDGDTLPIKITPTPARYIKIILTKDFLYNQWSIGEFWVFQ